MITKSKLAIKLSKLSTFTSPNLISEQYPIDSEIAAEILWFAYMNDDINSKILADLGCGTGILGIGCLLLGAKKVHFVDNDGKALVTATHNIKNLQLKNYEVQNSNVNDLNLRADVVVQNPPFGTKQKHADRDFLVKAFETAKVVYSLHKATSVSFVNNLAKDHGFTVTNLLPFKLPIKSQFSFHKRKIHRIDVICFRLTLS